MKSAYGGTKHIRAMFFKNFMYIKDYSLWDKRCIVLNFWLDDKKEQHKKLFP